MLEAGSIHQLHVASISNSTASISAAVLSIIPLWGNFLCFSSENQRFLSDCVVSIRKGNPPGVFSRRRLQRLLEEEVYRNFLLALTNLNIGHPVPKDQNHISDVVSNLLDLIIYK